MALDKTSLCNVALGHIGQPEIQDIDEDESTPARVCRTHFDLVRDSLFEKHDWDFLTKRLVLAKDATAPVNGYDNAFVLPTNWLRVLALNETDAKLASHLYAVENLGDETTDKIRLFTDHSGTRPCASILASEPPIGRLSVWRQCGNGRGRLRPFDRAIAK